MQLWVLGSGTQQRQGWGPLGAQPLHDCLSSQQVLILTSRKTTVREMGKHSHALGALSRPHLRSRLELFNIFSQHMKNELQAQGS